jgi:hypothetical protein
MASPAIDRWQYNSSLVLVASAIASTCSQFELLTAVEITLVASMTFIFRCYRRRCGVRAPYSRSLDDSTVLIMAARTPLVLAHLPYISFPGSSLVLSNVCT